MSEAASVQAPPKPLLSTCVQCLRAIAGSMIVSACHLIPCAHIVCGDCCAELRSPALVQGAGAAACRDIGCKQAVDTSRPWPRAFCAGRSDRLRRALEIALLDQGDFGSGEADKPEPAASAPPSSSDRPAGGAEPEQTPSEWDVCRTHNSAIEFVDCGDWAWLPYCEMCRKGTEVGVDKDEKEERKPRILPVAEAQQALAAEATRCLERLSVQVIAPLEYAASVEEWAAAETAQIEMWRAKHPVPSAAAWTEAETATSSKSASETSSLEEEEEQQQQEEKVEDSKVRAALLQRRIAADAAAANCLALVREIAGLRLKVGPALLVPRQGLRVSIEEAQLGLLNGAGASALSTNSRTAAAAAELALLVRCIVGSKLRLPSLSSLQEWTKRLPALSAAMLVEKAPRPGQGAEGAAGEITKGPSEDGDAAEGAAGDSSASEEDMSRSEVKEKEAVESLEKALHALRAAPTPRLRGLFQRSGLDFVRVANQSTNVIVSLCYCPVRSRCPSILVILPFPFLKRRPRKTRNRVSCRRLVHTRCSLSTTTRSSWASPISSHSRCGIWQRGF